MKTITFYSYKGGVGRTLALGNFAKYLAGKKHNVFVMDLDLEAPGLHYKLPPKEEELPEKLGFINYFNDWQIAGKIPNNLQEFIYEYKTDNDQPATISIMPAGNSKEDIYWRQLRKLDWRSILFSKFSKNKDDNEEVKEGIDAFFDLKELIRNYSTQPEYLLIDARTGITEVGGVATTLMADSVVLLFNDNEENFDGIRRVASAISKGLSIDDEKPINIFPVVVRLPALDSEYDENTNNEINEKFSNFLEESRKNKSLQPCQILHTDREIEVKESLLIGNSQANESSVLYRDYQILFDRLLGRSIFFGSAKKLVIFAFLLLVQSGLHRLASLLLDYPFSVEFLPEATKVSYGERMQRVISILDSIKLESSKTDTIAPIPRYLSKKIKIGAETGKPESDYSDKLRRLLSLRDVKDWESSLSGKLKLFDEFKEFWVLLPRFLAYEDSEFLNITGNNLMAEAKYIYFLPNSEDVTRLKTVAVEIVNNLIKQRKETQEEIKAEIKANNSAIAISCTFYFIVRSLF